MEYFTDIHSHLLPGVDDGSRNMEQTLEMVKIAYENGIRKIIVTPHYNRRYNLVNADVFDVYDEVRTAIRQSALDMLLYLGNEIYYDSEVPELLEQGQINTLAGSNYVLVEFSPVTVFQNIKEGLYQILLSGYRPILAHCERYQSIVEHRDYVKELIEMGVYIQVNATSVTGGNGRTAKKFVKQLMKSDDIHFIATDAHSDGTRAPKLDACVKWIGKKFGQDYVHTLLVQNPQKVLDNEII